MHRSLVIQLARFGDLVQTTRLLKTLSGRGEVHLLVDVSLVSLAELLFPHVRVHGVQAHAGGGRPGLLARHVVDELRSLDMDEVFNLNYSGLNFSLAAAFEPGRVRGYRMCSGQRLMDDWPALGFRFLRERDASPINLVDLWAHLADDPIDPAAVNPRPHPRGGGLGVVLAGRASRRSLPPEVLGPGVAVLAKSMDVKRVVLLGTKAERPLARALVRFMGGGVLDLVEDLAGRTGLDGLVREVEGLDRVLTPDTGTMHLAAFLGVPVTATFLSSAWAWETGPYGEGHTVYQAVLPCSPCLESETCPHGVACLKAFRHRYFLSLLATGASREPVEGLVGLRSGFDGLGGIYASFAGEDPHDSRRRSLRHLIAEYRGVSLRGPVPASQAELSAMAENLHRPLDWAMEPGRSIWE